MTGSLQFLDIWLQSQKQQGSSSLSLKHLALLHLQNATESACSAKKSSSAEGSGELSLTICESVNL